MGMECVLELRDWRLRQLSEKDGHSSMFSDWCALYLGYRFYQSCEKEMAMEIMMR